MSLQEPFEYDLEDLLWRLYSSAKYELTTYGRSVAENILIWILFYYLICGVLYALLYFKKNWSCSKIKGAKRALFVTAHPDDECMFFGPSIVHFVQQGIDVHLLCITEGGQHSFLSIARLFLTSRTITFVVQQGYFTI